MTICNDVILFSVVEEEVAEPIESVAVDIPVALLLTEEEMRGLYVESS
jgi:hypothetical protein